MTSAISDASALYLGIMSGTSMDGVDAVLVRFPQDFPASPLQQLGAYSQPFTPALRAQLFALQSTGADELERSALAAQALAHSYAQAVQALCAQCGVAPAQVRAIGAHGQTVRHRPELGYTAQLLNGALLAELSGIDVICDFRSRDVAAGGQGAPLVPAFHAALFGNTDSTRVVLNLGGIANISILHPAAVSGFDTGPANVLLDLWCQRQRDLPYDADGAWAASGQVHDGLLASLLDEAYFRLPPPKSTGRDLFDWPWLQQRLAHWPQLPAADVQATLAEFSAASIAQAIRQHAPDAASLLLCGGGARNRDLCQRLARLLPTLTLHDSGALGIDAQQVEALAFAWLARCQLLRQAGNLPAVTGARGPRVLGACYPA